MLLGIPGDNTYANYQEANRALWRLTLLPLVDRVLAGLSRFLSGDGEPLRLLADRDAIPALAIEREALWARVGLAGFMTLNEQRAAVGLSPIAGGDVLAADHGETVPPFERGGRPSAARQMKGQAVGATRAARFADLERDFDVAKASGKTHKIWRTRKDGDVRSSHAAMDGVRVDIDAVFDVNGARLFLPSDPEGPFDETANCRCFVEYVDEGVGAGDADRRASDEVPSPIKRGENAVLTDEEIATIVFNETASLSGPGIDDARVALANAVINGDERFGEDRPQTAGKRINRNISPNESQVLEQIRSVILPRVRAERLLGNDMALANNFFRLRDLESPCSREKLLALHHYTEIRLLRALAPSRIRFRQFNFQAALFLF
jgi:hypothetical protein